MSFSKNQLILFGLAAHLLAAIFTVGAHQADEIFQVFEFAGFKLGLNTAAELPWEFHEQMRSGIQPFIVFIITKALNSVAIQNPFTIALIVRLLQSLFSFLVIVKLLKFLEKQIVSPTSKLWLWAFGLLFWCLPYFHARFSSENFSMSLFILGLLIVLKDNRFSGSPFSFLMAGLFFGLAFVCRFQMSFMIAGLICWLFFIRKTKIVLLITCVLGIVLALALGLLADHWLYDNWTLSWWNYLDLNLFQDKASAFGREPFYFYLEQAFLQLIPPFSLIVIFGMLAFWIKFKSHWITWITIPFVFLHFFVSHKELRFLFPVLNFVPFIIIYYFQSVDLSQNKWLSFLKNKSFIRFAVTVNVILLCYYTFKPASNSAQTLKKIYELVEGEAPILLYQGTNPYNDLASLHYFRNPAITTLELNTDSTVIHSSSSYYFSEEYNPDNQLIVQQKTFVKVYSNFPVWFSYLNFNGWMERVGSYSIYKLRE